MISGRTECRWRCWRRSVCRLFSFSLAAFFGADLTRLLVYFLKQSPPWSLEKQHPEGGVADEL